MPDVDAIKAELKQAEAQLKVLEAKAPPMIEPGDANAWTKIREWMATGLGFEKAAMPRSRAKFIDWVKGSSTAMEALRRAPAIGQALGIESDVELPEVLLEAIGGGLKASAELGGRLLAKHTPEQLIALSPESAGLIRASVQQWQEEQQNRMRQSLDELKSETAKRRVDDVRRREAAGNPLVKGQVEKQEVARRRVLREHGFQVGHR